MVLKESIMSLVNYIKKHYIILVSKLMKNTTIPQENYNLNSLINMKFIVKLKKEIL